MRACAFDFVVKPVSPDRLMTAINNALKVEAVDSTRAPIVAAAIGEVPVGVDALFGMDAPDCIDPPVDEHCGIGLPALGKVDRIAQPAPRHHSVDWSWNNIKVAAKYARYAVFE